MSEEIRSPWGQALSGALLQRWPKDDRGEPEDHIHAFHEDLVQQIDPVNGRIRLFSHKDDREADDQSHDDDLQHIGFRDRLQEIGREDIDQGIHKGHRIAGFIGQIRGREHREKSLEEVRENETDNDGKRCCAEVIDDRTESDGSYLLYVRKRYDALNDRSDNDRNYDELEQVEEDSTERLNICFGKISCSCRQEDESCYDTKAEGDEYLDRQ